MAENVFKTRFKYYKQKDFKDFDSLVSFEENTNFYRNGTIIDYQLKCDVPHIFGVEPATKWHVYAIPDIPGLYAIRNPFTPLGQRYWIARALQDFTKKPSKRNVDIEEKFGALDDLWKYFKFNLSDLEKLRWSTLGYHHNWETKLYSEENKCPFPTDLALLSQHFTLALGFRSYDPHAAIINFYHPGSTLCGHVDKSEPNLSAPLVSFSFGQSAIFLMGGRTLQENVTPLLLQSGDVLIKSNDARLCYHAVPRILSVATTCWNEPFDFTEQVHSAFDQKLINLLCDDNYWDLFETVVRRSRINVNVRQVLLPLQNSLDNS